MFEYEDIKIDKKTFLELSDKDKWSYMESILKEMDKLSIMAEKNCSECDKIFAGEGDLNVDLLFEDWRECRERCDECGKEEQVGMCNLQFEMISFLAQEMVNINRKIRGISKLILTKHDVGKDIMEDFQKSMKTSRKNSEGMFG